jgi:hypothetical protein
MIFVILIFALIALFQIPGLVREKQWKEFAAFSFFYLAALVLSVLYALDVDIPSPMKAIGYIVEDLLHLKY